MRHQLFLLGLLSAACCPQANAAATKRRIPSPTPSPTKSPTPIPTPRTLVARDDTRPIYVPIRANDARIINPNYSQMGHDLNPEHHVYIGNEDMVYGEIIWDTKNGESVMFLGEDELEEELNLAFCNETTVEMNFKDEVEFQDIRKKWSFINDHRDNHVLLLTNNVQCDLGNDSTNHLQPWIVTKADFDDPANNVTLTAEHKEFHELPYNWNINFSSQGMFPNTPGRQRRAARKREDPTVSEDFTNNSTNTSDISLEVEIPRVGVGLTAQGSGGTIVKDGQALFGKPPDMTIECNECAIHGGLDFDMNIHADTNSKTLLGGSFEFKAKNVSATVKILTTINSVMKNVLTKEVQVFGWVPPGLGFYLGKIIDIGPTVILVFRFSVGQNPKPLAFQVGFEASLDPDSGFKLDFGDPSKSDATGWRPHFKALEPQVTDGFSLTAEVGPAIQLVIAGKVLTQGAEAGFEAVGTNLAFKLSEVDGKDGCAKKNIAHRNLNGRTAMVKNGTQSVDTRNLKNGTQSMDKTDHNLQCEIGLTNHVDAFADMKVIGYSTAVVKTLWSTNTPLYSTCRTLDNKNVLTMQTNLPTTKVESFSASNFVESVISKVEEVVKTVTSEAVQAVNTVTHGAVQAESTLTAVGKSVGDAITGGAGDALGAIGIHF